MARKSKLTKELIARADKLLKAGNYHTTVCQYLNIHPSTWYRWLQEGEKARSGIKKEFYDTVKKAEAEAEIRLITELQKISQEENNWQAIAWMLERKFPERWGKRDRRDDELRSLELKKMEKAIDKTKAETEFIEERTKLIKGTAKDTSLLNALIDVVKGDDE